MAEGAGGVGSGPGASGGTGLSGWFAVAGLALGVALVAWLSGGALALVSGASSRRLGLLPGWGMPLLAAGGVTLVAVALRHLGGSRRVLLPLSFLLVLALPWLPASLPPAFLLWSGPLVKWVWVTAALAVIAAAWPARSAMLLRAKAFLGHPWRGAWTAAGLAFVIYGAAASQLTTVLPSGDEPHYLVITQSLLKDGDLRIENNHRQGDYKQYFPGELRPDYLRRGTDRQIYSIHAPGLAAIVLPAFAIAGYPGVMAFLALMSALATLLVWRAAYRLTSDAGAAWFGWAAVALSAPFFFHAFTAYPDGLGAAIVMSGVAVLVKLDADSRRDRSVAGDACRCEPPTPVWQWALSGAALAVLPWLHTRHAAAAAVLGACIVLRLLGRRKWGAVAAFLVVPAGSAAAWFGYFYTIYGRFSPAAPYGHYTQSSLANVPRALPALFLDQQFGIVPNAPVYAFALAGLVALWRARTRLAAEVTLLFGTYLSLVAAYHMWWGGRSAPARFAVPVLLVFGLPAASFWPARRSGRVLAVLALGISILITGSLVLADSGWLIFNNRDGSARWLQWVAPLVELPDALPSFLRGSTSQPLIASAIWLGAMLLVAGGLRWVVRRPGTCERRRGRVALAAVSLVAAGVMLAASVTWAVTDADGFCTRSQVALLKAFDPARLPVGLVLQPLRAVAPGEAVRRLEVAGVAGGGAAGKGPLFVLADVPAGTYRLTPAALAGARGRLSVLVGRSTEPIEQWSLGGSTPEALDRVLRLPVSVNAVTISGDEDAARTVKSLSLRPIAVVPKSQRVASENARRARRYGAVMVYAFDDYAYLESPGLWIEGRADARVAVAPAAEAGGVRMLLRNGATANRVELRAGAWSLTVALAPQEERVIEVPIERAKGAALLAVRTSHGFRPAEVDSASRDQRFLGVWLEFP